jgi:hypothetical protein
VASIQTISRPRRLAQLGQFGLIIVDEDALEDLQEDPDDAYDRQIDFEIERYD